MVTTVWPLKGKGGNKYLQNGKTIELDRQF